MEQYKINQLVYTKLDEKDSPFEKKDFHTAFYPLDLLSSTDVLVIENHIYIPTNDEFTSKQVVYFTTIKDETYLLVIDIQLLPNEVDMHGRGGIFMAHAFIFPQALWQQIPSPNQLMQLIKGEKYKSRKELLNSKYIDKENGNIAPIELNIEDPRQLTMELPPVDGAFEIQLILHLLESLRAENREQRFVLKASEEEARNLVNKLICYLPNELKVKIGWDTMYDGGRMMDYNKSLVAYHEREPRGGSGSSYIGFLNSKVELAKDFKVSKRRTPFMNWIAACSASIKGHSYIEAAHKLSEALLAKDKCEISEDWNMECFAEHNMDVIQKLFLSKCKKEFKSKLSKELSKTLSNKNKLLYYLDKLDFSIIADHILYIIETSTISAKQFEKNVPQKYIKHNSILVLIEQLWQNDKFNLDAFNHLIDNEKLQVNKYVLKTTILKTEWYLELIKNDAVLLNYFLRQYEKPKRIISLFRRVLNMNEAEINELGFSLKAIQKVFYFRVAFILKKISRVFKRKKKKKEKAS